MGGSAVVSMFQGRRARWLAGHAGSGTDRCSDRDVCSNDPNRRYRQNQLGGRRRVRGRRWARRPRARAGMVHLQTSNQCPLGVPRRDSRQRSPSEHSRTQWYARSRSCQRVGPERAPAAARPRNLSQPQRHPPGDQLEPVPRSSRPVKTTRRGRSVGGVAWVGWAKVRADMKKRL